MDKIELKNKIRSLDGLTNEEKSALIEMLNHNKKYGLVWEDKPEAVEERLRDELPVFREVKERAIVSDADDAPNHILVEGDNLEALTALSYTHAGKIDVIYIDPPYNTGNKDFVYNDSFVDSEDSFRHSKWLSFMDKRLKLAKGLLSDKGVIFISIDDNEQAQLKLLCDEVFGESNFITDVAWRSSDSSNHDAKRFSIDYNHTLIYSKCERWQPHRLERTEKDNQHYSNPDNDPRGPWFSGNLSSPNPRENLKYDIISPSGIKIHPPKNGWRWSKSKVDEMISKKEIIFSSDEKRIIKKTFLANQQGLVPSNLWLDLDITGHNRNAKYELKKLFPEKATSTLFSTPKPTKLIRFIEKIASNDDSTILDFFAGSGTTLHATMQLNKEDGGHRKCILVTNNENGICENVTYERNKRVINGYTTPKGERVEGLYANTLRYYKTGFISRDPSPRNMRALVAASTDLLCIKNDIYTEADFAGKKLNKKIVRYFEDKHCRMLVIYDERAIGAIVELLEAVETDERGKIKVYTFSPSRYAFDDEFIEAADKVELCALPAAIYDAYKQVLPKRKPKYLPEALYEERTTTEPTRENIAAESDADYRKKGGKS